MLHPQFRHTLPYNSARNLTEAKCSCFPHPSTCHPKAPYLKGHSTQLVFPLPQSELWKQWIQKPWPDFPGCPLLPTTRVSICSWTLCFRGNLHVSKQQAGPGHKVLESPIRLTSPHFPLLQLLCNSSHRIPVLIIVLFTLHRAVIKGSTGGVEISQLVIPTSHTSGP